jgi:hypothetical protein
MNISGTMDASTGGSLLSPRLSVQILYLRNYSAYTYTYIYVCVCVYREFHNVLRDYKQENQRTCLNGSVHSHRKTENVFLTTRVVRCVHHG